MTDMKTRIRQRDDFALSLTKLSDQQIDETLSASAALDALLEGHGEAAARRACLMWLYDHAGLPAADYDYYMEEKARREGLLPWVRHCVATAKAKADAEAKAAAEVAAKAKRPKRPVLRSGLQPSDIEIASTSTPEQRWSVAQVEKLRNILAHPRNLHQFMETEG